MSVVIALGSNLGDRAANIARAVSSMDAHPAIEVIRVSRIRETEPVGDAQQGPFLNGAVLVRTTLAPHALLETCLEVERGMGRCRNAARRNGPRVIDLDVLLYDDAIIDAPGLVIPHPRIAERAFVLDPLVDLIPDVVHPTLGVTMRALHDQVSPGVTA